MGPWSFPDGHRNFTRMQIPHHISTSPIDWERTPNNFCSRFFIVFSMYLKGTFYLVIIQTQKNVYNKSEN